MSRNDEPGITFDHSPLGPDPQSMPLPEGMVRLTALYTDVYNGAEYPRELTIDVEPPTEDIDEWADKYLWPHTGTGERLSGEEAGYFVKILHCEAHPELENEEFDWGL
ncbi:hypothetical protein [Mycobacteroides abscessus]